MDQNKLLTIREAAEVLGVTDQEIIDLVEEGKIPAYKIGGVYLRFKPEHIQQVRQKITPPSKAKVSLADRLHDFFYFNDFYILAVLIIILMLIIILKT
ncbi:MAG: helix-turn-helix domain-containing protein [Candidatus Omnitrophota bacterium]|jgi:excisionase family DNA binding protein